MALEDFSRTVFIWDRADKKIFNVVKAKDGDNNGRKLLVQVRNQNVVEDLTGYALNLGWETLDGSHYGLDSFDVVDAEQGIFEITFKTGMLSNIGRLISALQLVWSTGVIESPNFIIEVTASPVNGEAMESSNSFGALETALMNVQGLAIGEMLALETRMGVLESEMEVSGRGWGASYATTVALETAIPTGDNLLHVITGTGHWYYWSGSAWTDGGVFQSSAPNPATLLPEIQAAALATNSLTNGDISQGTTSWSGFSATLSAANNVLSVTGSSSGSVGYGGATHNFGTDDAVGTKYFYKYTARVTNAVCQKIGIRSSSTAVTNTEIANPVQDQWYTKAGGFTKTASAGTATNFSITEYYADAATRNGKVMEVKDCIVVNLTAIYGAGNEPSYEDFDVYYKNWLSAWLLEEKARVDALELIPTFAESFPLMEGAALGVNMISQSKDFVNTTGWTTFFSTMVATDGKLAITGTSNAYSGAETNVGVGSPTGSKFYYQYTMRVRNDGCQKIGLRSSGSSIPNTEIANPVKDQWYTKSGGFTKTAGVNSNTNVACTQYYTNSTGMVLEVAEIIAVDLTAIYGAGNEPSYDSFGTVWGIWLADYLKAEKARLDALAGPSDLTEYEAVEAEVLAKQKSKSFDYVFITDPHLINSRYDTGIAKLERAVHFANMQFVDYLVFGGDFLNESGYNEDIAISRAKMLAVKKILAKSKVPVICLHGNHDDNSTTQFLHTEAQNFSQEEFYNLLIRPFEAEQHFIHDSQKSDSTYFYKDFPVKKMRLIVLDGCDYPIMDDGSGNFKYRGADWFGYGARQVTWLGTEALVGIPSGYRVVVLSHLGVGSSYNNGTLIEGQLSACHAGTAYSGTNANADYGVSVNVDFTAQGARPILSFQCGHNHVDSVSLRAGGWNVVVTDDCITDEVIDVTTVDGVTGKTYFTRIGTGTDRELTY